jgi:hypothetical protein
MWCAVIASISMAVLSGCQGTSYEPERASVATTPADAAHAARATEVEQESEQLRKERDRLKAELSAKGTKDMKSPSSTATDTPTIEPSSSVSLSNRPQAGFDELAAQLGGSVGLAYAGVGSGAITQLGSWQTGPGWSTVKVPLVVAAVAKTQHQSDHRVQRLMRLAITQSDNAAAEQLWAYLGEPQAAASQVQAVLRSGGDGDTDVQSQRVRPGFSAFGQTTWSLINQAAFVSTLPCIKHSDDVLQLMGDVAPGQRWGIGAVGLPAQFKGGWGPGLGGGYLVRQMGIVTLANGWRIGLAIASEPEDGRFETGTANLTALARWAVANAQVKGPGGC